MRLKSDGFAKVEAVRKLCRKDDDMTYATSPTPAARPGGSPKALQLEYPLSVCVFTKYEDAQRCVDYLADQSFPVENLAIVGTDLRQYERVVAKKGWGGVLAQGAVSGLLNGLFFAVMLWLLQITLTMWSSLLWGLLLGVAFGVIAAAIGHLVRRNTERDFESITQTFARSYEVLCEHKEAEHARSLLAQMPNSPLTAELAGYATSLSAPYAGTQATTPTPVTGMSASMPQVAYLPGQTAPQPTNETVPSTEFDPRRPSQAGEVALGSKEDATDD